VRAVAYLLGLLLSLPFLAFATGVLALGHAIGTRDVLTLLSHFALAFMWGVPLAVLAVALLAACAFFRRARLGGAAALALLDVAALVVVLRATGLPRDAAETVWLAPTLAALGLFAGLLLTGKERRG